MPSTATPAATGRRHGGRDDGTAGETVSRRDAHILLLAISTTILCDLILLVTQVDYQKK